MFTKPLNRPFIITKYRMCILQNTEREHGDVCPHRDNKHEVRKQQRRREETSFRYENDEGGGGKWQRYGVGKGVGSEGVRTTIFGTTLTATLKRVLQPSDRGRLTKGKKYIPRSAQGSSLGPSLNGGRVETDAGTDHVRCVTDNRLSNYSYKWNNGRLTSFLSAADTTTNGGEH